jgi:stage V sporulation protein AF
VPNGEVKGNISKKLSENLDLLKRELEIGEKNFDLILKEMMIGGKKAALLFVDGLTNGEITTLIMQSLARLKREQIIPLTADKLLRELIPYVEINPVEKMDEAIIQSLSGPMVLFIDGERQALVIDTRQYPARGPEEPDIEKVTRGSRDGFVETLIFNIALIRRRIRDPKLRVEAIRAGRRAAADISIMYIKDIANEVVVDRIRSRINKINVDALPMAEKTVEEFSTRAFWNPFPEVRYTERPDVAATHLLEGHVVIIVDTSPSVMIAPVTFFHHLQHAEEFRHEPLIGTYMRWIRIIGIFLSVYLIPVWLLLAEQQELLPPFLAFIGPEEDLTLPLFVQFIIAHFGLDLLRMASVHTPTPFATALGLVGGLLIGQIAVDVGFFIPEVLLYTGIVALGVFSTPSWELSMTSRVVLLFLIVMTGLLRLPGLLLGTVLILLCLVTTRSFGFPYFWPVIPFDLKGIYGVLIRRPLPYKVFRPSYLRTLDSDRTRKEK